MFTVIFHEMQNFFKSFASQITQNKMRTPRFVQYHTLILNVPDDGCKLNDNRLLKTISKYDIYVLSEIWGCNHEINVPVFEKLILQPTKMWLQI